MLSKNRKAILVIALMGAFASNSFAWGYARGHTVCRGATCHHTTVHKGCVNGHCGTVRHGSTWHR